MVHLFSPKVTRDTEATRGQYKPRCFGRSWWFPLRSLVIFWFLKRTCNTFNLIYIYTHLYSYKYVLCTVKTCVFFWDIDSYYFIPMIFKKCVDDYIHIFVFMLHLFFESIYDIDMASYRVFFSGKLVFFVKLSSNASCFSLDNTVPPKSADHLDPFSWPIFQRSIVQYPPYELCLLLKKTWLSCTQDSRYLGFSEAMKNADVPHFRVWFLKLFKSWVALFFGNPLLRKFIQICVCKCWRKNQGRIPVWQSIDTVNDMLMVDIRH